jgi:nucleotide-binding universal stress UspA family protein
MTRLVIGYDGSDCARSAIAAAAALLPHATAVVATVQPPPPADQAGGMARIALPDAVIREGLERMRAENERRARELAHEGAAEYLRVAGSHATVATPSGRSTWRTLQQFAGEVDADVLVCGTRGQGAVDRVLLGSTASSLLHHAERPLLVVPGRPGALDGPVLAGWDGSEGARAALRFAAAHLPDRALVVAHAWRSPVGHSLRGRALARSGVEVFEDYAHGLDQVWGEVARDTAGEGVEYARELELTAEALAPESGGGDARTLLGAAADAGAAAILVGTRGRGAVESTVLGSVTSGLVHAAERPVVVVPDVRDAS